MSSCLRPTAISIKSGLPDTQLHSWHCHVGWIQTGLCCAYSRLLSQALDVNPSFLFGDTTKTHSKTLDSDGVSTSCYLWWNASKPHHLVLSKADVWNLLLQCCSDVYCNTIGNSLPGSQGVCRQPFTGHHKNRQHSISCDCVTHLSVCADSLMNGNMSPDVEGQPFCQIHKMWLALQELVAWLLIIYINDVSLYMSTFSSAVCLANQRWITAWTHSFIHICGTVAILELVLFVHTCCHNCTNHLWCTVTAHVIYIFSCNYSPIKKTEKFTS